MRLQDDLKENVKWSMITQQGSPVRQQAVIDKGIRWLNKSGMLVKRVGMSAGTMKILDYWGCPLAGPLGGQRLVGILWNTDRHWWRSV
jgi:hypothetical protein